MTPKEIREGMTRGEWDNSGLYIFVKGQPQHQTVGQCHLRQTGVDKRGRRIEDMESKHNPIAITSAVNSTYGKGYNPEAMEDMHKALQLVRQWFNTFKSYNPDFNLEENVVYHEVLNALTKSKL